MTIHLCDLPENCSGYRSERTTHVPCSILLRVGLAELTKSPSTLVRSYHTVSPLPEPVARPSAVSLCCTVREVAPTWLPPALCSMESRLSSVESEDPTAVTRSTHRRLQATGDLDSGGHGTCRVERPCDGSAVEVLVGHRVETRCLEIHRRANA